MRSNIGVALASEDPEPLQADPVDQSRRHLVQKPDDVRDPREHDHRAVSFNAGQYGARCALGAPLREQEMRPAAVALDGGLVEVHDRQVLVDVGLHVAWADATDLHTQVRALKTKTERETDDAPLRR